jgi:bifunctional non-homologous end joining protein LigD
MAHDRGSQQVVIDGRAVRLTNQDKELWPGEGLTKGDLVAYYRKVAPVILPHLRERPLTLKIYPDGIDASPIFLQAAPRGTPEWVQKWQHYLVSRAGGDAVNWRIIAADEATLAWLGNRAAIELHTWLSRITTPEVPDTMLIDLDPGPEVTFDEVCRAALQMRATFKHAGLEVWPKTSGGKGMHVCVPLAPGYTFEQVRAWAEQIAEAYQRRWPDRFTHLAAKEERPGRIMIDYAQNSLGRTTAAVYSARARPGAPVSAPLSWDEVRAGRRGDLLPVQFTIRTMPARIAAMGDLYAPVLNTPQRFPDTFEGYTASGEEEGG